MKDAIYQDINIGDLIVILNPYHNNIGGIVIGETKGGKIRYIHPIIEYEWYEDDVNDDEEYVECKQCGGYCNGHFKRWIVQTNNSDNFRVIKITEEQLNQFTLPDFSEEDDDTTRILLDAEIRANRKLIEMYNEKK